MKKPALDTYLHDLRASSSASACSAAALQPSPVILWSPAH